MNYFASMLATEVKPLGLPDTSTATKSERCARGHKLAKFEKCKRAFELLRWKCTTTEFEAVAHVAKGRDTLRKLEAEGVIKQLGESASGRASRWQWIGARN